MNKEPEWEVITDPEKLFHLQKAEWEIEFSGRGVDWCLWNSAAWNRAWYFRARPPKPKMKKVKMLCFYNGHTIFWAESGKGHAYTCRVPDEDKEIEVPE